MYVYKLSSYVTNLANLTVEKEDKWGGGEGGHHLHAVWATGHINYVFIHAFYLHNHVVPLAVYIFKQNLFEFMNLFIRLQYYLLLILSFVLCTVWELFVRTRK